MSTTLKRKHKQRSLSYEKTAHKKIAIISISAVILAAVCVFLMISYNAFEIMGWRFLPAAKAEDGTLSVSTDDGSDLTSIPDGQIRYRINNNITFENGYSKGDVMLENPKACKYNLKFCFYIESTSQLIYTSDSIEPGQYITSDKLSVRLKEGIYNCVYTANAYENDTLVGEISGYLTINVKS